MNAISNFHLFPVFLLYQNLFLNPLCLQFWLIVCWLVIILLFWVSLVGNLVYLTWLNFVVSVRIIGNLAYLNWFISYFTLLIVGNPVYLTWLNIVNLIKKLSTYKLCYKISCQPLIMQFHYRDGKNYKTAEILAQLSYIIK